MSKLLVFLGFLEVLEGLERSGRLVGKFFLVFSCGSDFMVPSYDQKAPPDHPGRTDGRKKLGKTLVYFIFPYSFFVFQGWNQRILALDI